MSPVSARRAALEVLCEVTDDGAYCNIALKQVLDSYELREKKWLSAVVYNALEHLSHTDYVLNSYCKSKLNRYIRGILRLYAAQLLFMGTPARVVCNEAVGLAREIGKGSLSGFVNGVMRSLCRDFEVNCLPKLPSNVNDAIGIEFGYPLFIVNEYIERFGEQATREMLSYKDYGMSLRSQPPFTDEMLEQYLHENGIEYDRGEIAQEVFKLKSGIAVESNELFRSGRITVQSESSVLVCKACDAKENQSVLDCCAAPGGKSALLSAMMENSGRLVCCELHEHRAKLLQNTLTRLGVCNAEIITRDMTQPIGGYKELFDVVLIDAPCSGFGVYGKPDARMRRTEENVVELCSVQRKLLRTCCEYVKRGGKIVYSTCTVSKRENEDVLFDFLSSDSRFELGALSGIASDKLKERVSRGMLHLLPHIDRTEGFFVCEMVRKDDKNG